MWKNLNFDRFSRPLNSALAVALIGVTFGWLVQCQQTRETQRLSYQMEQISAFKDSGTKLDSTVVDMFNGLAGGKDVDKHREKFNNAITEHVLRTESDRIIFGDTNADAYLKALNVLRTEVDNASDARNSGARVSAFGKVIEKRRTLMKSAIDT